jgi:hypothetical protein
VPFQVTGCQSLPFAPRVSATTPAQASRRGSGAGLQLTITAGSGAHANIRSAVIELPRQLRPRLTTIQGACPQRTFAEDPGACPVTSVVGNVTASTPVLGSPLTGPIYLVSHGTEYPVIVLVAQAQGIELEVSGEIGISSSGVISTAFRALPDAPFSSLRLEFPRGAHSLLGAVTGLCGETLAVPYTITGQNGALIRSTIRTAVQGCVRRRTRGRRRSQQSLMSEAGRLRATN